MRYLAVGVGLVSLVLVAGHALLPRVPFVSDPVFTVSYSAAQARYLGLDAAKVWRAVLVELKPKHVRLQANWNSVEPQPAQFDFTELDSLISEANSAGASVTLAVGRKLPRWPECHDPAWLTGLRSEEVEQRLMVYLSTILEHYRSNPAVVRWQVENEPMFAYGACVAPNWHRLVREVELVKKLDPTRPVLLTDSGELSSWWETARLADEQGTTLYRVTWNPVFRYFTYPWPPFYYRLKAALVAPFVRRTVVSELQLEPWAPAGLRSLSLSEAQRSLSVARFSDNVNFFRQTGLPEAMLWGVEWWYYAKEKLGEPGYWQAAGNLF